jgi:hypothetical protein
VLAAELSLDLLGTVSDGAKQPAGVGARHDEL